MDEGELARAIDMKDWWVLKSGCRGAGIFWLAGTGRSSTEYF